MKKPIRHSLGLLVLCAAAGAHGQAASPTSPAPTPPGQASPAPAPQQQQGEVYRSTLPNGEVIYSDKPAPGAKSSKPVPRANPGANSVAPAVTREEIAATNKRLAGKSQKLDAAGDRRLKAWDRLQAARDAKARGEEPLPGERTGNAGGNSRLNSAYWARQKKLDRDLAAAQREYDRANEAYRQAM
jgi:hypothetical protein